VHDTKRIEFLDGYIHAMLQARESGVDIRGYFVWSTLDNFEWAGGYRPTFGIVRVDFDTLKRTRKDSFYWYKDFIKDHPRIGIHHDGVHAENAADGSGKSAASS